MTPDHETTRPSPLDDNRTRSHPDDGTATAATPLRQDTPTAIPDSPEPEGPTVAVDAPTGFTVERELGVGGMGVVYLARQVGLNRPVALKLVKGADRVAPTALIRFLAEAEAVAAVKHPNVVEVYQYGEHHGKPYMALEYCPGGDLTALTKSEPVSSTPGMSRTTTWFRETADLMAKIADGVNAAHSQGIVHRDLKPHNVFLTADGTPKVADFGLAKRGLGSDLTHTGAILGTPAYMAPEQAGGGTKFVGPEADVWALGVMLYELCCGSRPIDTSGPVLEAVAKVAKGEVSQLRTKAPAVPSDLALIAHKCLSPDPRDRYPTAGVLAADLRHWLDGRLISARKVGAVEQAVKWAKRNKTLAGMGLAVLFTMAAATAVSLGFGLEANTQRKNADDKAGALTVALGEKTTALGEKTKAEADAQQKANELADQLKESERRLDLSRLREAEADFERNAIQFARDKLAAVAPENRGIAWGLLNRRLQGGDLTLYGHTSGVLCVAFSPDGRRVVTGSRDQTARVWDAVTGQSVLELQGHTGQVTSADLSPDGRRVVTGSWDQTVRVWDSATGRSLLKLKGHTHNVTSVSFSPDGRRITTGSTDKTARVWDAVTGQSLLELKHTGQVTSVCFSPDGRRVVTGSYDKMARVWDAGIGQSLLKLKGHTELVTSVAFSPDGRRIVTSSDHAARVWDTATGESLLVLIGHTGNVNSVVFSPDGRSLVTGSADGTTRVWDADTGQSLIELKGHTREVANVCISPDGQRIVTGSEDRTARVWDAATGQSLIVLKGHTGAVLGVAFSPNGRRM